MEEAKKVHGEKIRPDPEKAESLKEIALRRLEFIEERKDEVEPVLLWVEYFEAVRGLMNSLIYIRGCREYSFKELVRFLEKFHGGFTKYELEVIRDLRKVRNNIVYHGIAPEEGFLDVDDVEDVIEKLVGEADEMISLQ